MGMRMIVVYRLDALMFGVILAVIKMESARWWRALQSLFPLGVLILLVSAIIAHRAFPNDDPLIPAAWLLTMIPLGVALVLPGVTRLERTHRLVASVIGQVSRSSYSMYLCHLPHPVFS